MDGKTLARLLQERPAGLEAEVMVWGRMALAFSARCFTARHFRLKKDECGFRCIEHPDGLDMRTRESRDFLAINGIQVQSAACLDLLSQAPELASLGVEVLRVSPQSAGTLEAVVALDAIRRNVPAAAVEPPAGIGRCNGYYYGKSGIEMLEAVA
jgi:collagenase-like PrtC family protease